MKLTKSVLMRLIKEEISRMQEEVTGHPDQIAFDKITGDDKDKYELMYNYVFPEGHSQVFAGQSADPNRPKLDYDLVARVSGPLDRLKAAILHGDKTGIKNAYSELAGEGLTPEKVEKEMAANQLAEIRRRRRVLPRRR